MYSIIKNLIVSLSQIAFIFILGWHCSFADEGQELEHVLQTKGIAVYQDLGIEYYVASLALERLDITSAELQSFEGDQSIKIKVTAERWSKRKWKAQWQNNIAINNLPSDDVKLNAQLAHFTQFPKGSLKRGDEVLISYSPQFGSRVLFNGHLVLSSDTKEFYSYLLNTWIGKFSPNRIFREKITGVLPLNDELVAYSRQPVASDRTTEVKVWFSIEKQDVERKKQQALLAQKNKEKYLKEQQALKLEQQRLKAVAAQKALQAKAKEKARLIAAEEARLKRKREQAESEKKKRFAKLASEKKLAALKAEKEKIRAQNKQVYLYELYQWQLQTKINESVVYPPWARQFNQEGNVILAFQLNRAGNISALDSSKSLASKILLQEVEKRLNFVVESHGIPKDLSGDHWSFKVNYQFSLKTGEQKPLVKPQLATVD